MSQMLGSNALWEMVKHVLPNIMPIIIINMAGSLGGVVMMEASINFLGYGVNVGTPPGATSLPTRAGTLCSSTRCWPLPPAC